MRKKHADLLIGKGRLQIGTLYEYRDIEKHGNIIGDATEGQKSLYLEVDNDKWTSDSQDSFSKKFIKISPGSSVQLQNVNFEKKQNSPNYYLYCTTEEFNKKSLHNFNYDSCVVIENPEKFFYAITRALRDKGTFEGVFPCQYGSRRVPHDQDPGIHPALIKNSSYKDQKEVRALWKPTHEDIVPLIIDCPYAARHCHYYKKPGTATSLFSL